MNFKENDHVKIKKSGVKGVIIDMRTWDNRCTVEADERNEAGDFEMYDCAYDEIELI